MEVLDRVQTERGELALRRDGDRWEIISNGVFLMDTSDGTSERLLIEAALRRCAVGAPRILIGGLGVGFSLVRAVVEGHLAAIDVVEIEPTIVRWHHEHLGAISAAAIADPRVRIVEADVRDHLAAIATERSAILDASCSDQGRLTAKPVQDRGSWADGSHGPPASTDKSDTAPRFGSAGGGYDVICLDTDNGPNWLVFDSNAGIYDDGGLALAADALAPGGVVAVWSASRDSDFEARLHARFRDIEILETPRTRGVPDVVYLASR